MRSVSRREKSSSGAVESRLDPRFSAPSDMALVAPSGANPMLSGERRIKKASGRAPRRKPARHRARAVAVDAVTAERAFKGALRAGERKSQRGCCKGKSQLLSHGQKENGEAIGVQAAAEHANCAAPRHHPPPIVKLRQPSLET